MPGVVVPAFNPPGHRSKQIFVTLKPAWFMEGGPGRSGLHRGILSEINSVRKSQTTNKQTNKQKLFQGWTESGTSFSLWGGSLDSSASSVPWGLMINRGGQGFPLQSVGKSAIAVGKASGFKAEPRNLGKGRNQDIYPQEGWEYHRGLAE